MTRYHFILIGLGLGLASVLLSSSVAFGQATATQKVPKERFTDDREKGWHWYENPPVKTDPKKVEEKVEKAPGPAPFSVPWLSQKLEEYKLIAVNNPTRENVERYNYMQKLVLDKAEKFALMSQEVNTLNPTLDETIANPVTSYASNLQQSIRNEKTDEIIKKLGSEVGIYYFYKSDCPYCLKMNTIINNLKNKDGFSVMGIALDGKPMPDGKITAWVPDRGQASSLGVTSTPTLYMFKPPGQVVLVSAGLQTVPELKKRIIQVANANKWITKEEFELAMKGMRRDFFIDAATAEGTINWEDPDDVLVKLREISNYGVEKANVDTNAVFQGTPWVEGSK